MGKFRYPFNTRIKGVPDQLLTALADNFRRAVTTEEMTAAFVANARMPVGAVLDFAGVNVPNGWLLCYGQQVARATYPILFEALCPTLFSTATANAATDTLTTSTPHGLIAGDAIFFDIAVSGVAANTTYYVRTAPTTTTLTLTATRTMNPIDGSPTLGALVDITANGSVTGLRRCPHGGVTTTHFAVPDFRGRVAVGLDSMGSVDGGVIGWANLLGAASGEAKHRLLDTESGLPAHTVSGTTGNDAPDHVHAVAPGHSNFLTALASVGFAAGGPYAFGQASVTGGRTTFHQHPFSASVAGALASTDHNVMQPGVLVNKIICTGA